MRRCDVMVGVRINVAVRVVDEYGQVGDEGNVADDCLGAWDGEEATMYRLWLIVLCIVMCCTHFVFVAHLSTYLPKHKHEAESQNITVVIERKEKEGADHHPCNIDYAQIGK